MLIVLSAYIQKCSCEGRHYATICTTDGNFHPFLTISQGRQILSKLRERGTISNEEFKFLASEVVSLELPFDAEEMAENLGVPTDVIEEVCAKAAIYFKNIMNMEDNADNLPVM